MKFKCLNENYYQICLKIITIFKQNIRLLQYSYICFSFENIAYLNSTYHPAKVKLKVKILSTNIAKPTTIMFNGEEVITGIYKTPTNKPIYLGKETVEGDEISDREVHGGEFKACYLFSGNYYSYWKKLYPNLNWNYGMLGENLTVSDLDESKIHIGNIYKIGHALVQITQPREPCYKFGVKFGNQRVLKQFVRHSCPGTYVRVLEAGFVKTGDEFILIKEAKNSLTITQFFKLIFSKTKNQEHLQLAIINDALPLKKRNDLREFIE